MVGYNGQVFLCVFVNLDEVEANKNVRTRPDIRGTQRGYSSKPLNIALLNVF